MKRTKIICTLGPASSKKTVLKAMMRAGMDIARFIFPMALMKNTEGAWT